MAPDELKSTTIRLTIAPDLKAWIDLQAEDIGCDAATWVKMLVVAARKGLAMPSGPLPVVIPQFSFPSPTVLGQDLRTYSTSTAASADDAWRGPVEDQPVDTATTPEMSALLAAKLAEAEANGSLNPPLPPQEVFAQPSQVFHGKGLRVLVRPPAKYSIASPEGSLRGIG